MGQGGRLLRVGLPSSWWRWDTRPSAGGYAALLNKSGTVLIDSFSGLQWADGGYNSCDNGGMYYEFKLPLSLLGLLSVPPQQVNFAAYTTYEVTGSTPTTAAPAAASQVRTSRSATTRTTAITAGRTSIVCRDERRVVWLPDFDDNNGPGNAIGGRFPASDNSGFGSTRFRVLGDHQLRRGSPVAAEKTTWGRVKALYP